MGSRRPAAAMLVLLVLGAGEAVAQGEWTVRSPAIARKADRRVTAAALAGLALSAIFLRRRRPR